MGVYMLTFDQKLAIIESFPELERKNVSLGRVNFQYEESNTDKKNIVYHLHPNGNGFVYAGHLLNYDTDEKGMINIRDFSEEEIRNLIKDSINQLSPIEKSVPDAAIIEDRQEEQWIDRDKNVLILVHEEETWNVYFGNNLEDTFGTYDEAKMFLIAEGCRKRSR
jgi:hypothetical protein